MSVRARAAAAVATSLVSAGLVVSTSAPADALVLVSAPAASVKVNRHIEVGVWYRAWEGGPRAYRVRVTNPAGREVFFREGRAPNQWRLWSVPVRRIGVYRTVYRAKGFDGVWRRSVFRTTVHR